MLLLFLANLLPWYTGTARPQHLARTKVPCIPPVVFLHFQLDHGTSIEHFLSLYSTYFTPPEVGWVGRVAWA